MRLVKLSDIAIKPNRQRQEFDPIALMELAESIRDRGLFHPPVVRLEGGQTVLVAGERRLKAMTSLWELGDAFSYAGEPVAEGFIPVNDVGELDELEAEEAELDENLKRRDLTWQEHAQAVQRLHELRQKQKSTAHAKMADDGIFIPAPKQTVADTAKELHGRSDGSFQDSVRKELIVARFLDQPAVAKAKSADEAFKIIKAEEERKKNIELAASVGKDFTSSAHTLLNQDCRVFMAETEERFDVILTDPPYGMNAQAFGDGGGKLAQIEHHYNDTPEEWRKLMATWANLSFRVAKEQAHAYVFCDNDRFHELKAFMEAAGWYVFRTPFIVHKINSGRVPLPDRGPRRSWEMLLYAIKGNKPVTHIFPDVIPCQADENMSHGAQKPVALYQNLLQRSAKPGDKVLDSFAGSGTIFPAAHLMKVKATGVEANPEYYAMALKRLQALDEEG